MGNDQQKMAQCKGELIGRRTIKECEDNRELIEQWVYRVLNVSSQYDCDSWCGTHVEGPPKVYPKYGDIPGAWAQGTKDANQFIEVEFQHEVFIEKIEIYETYHAGGVKKILARQPNGGWCSVWETHKVSNIRQSRIFTVQPEKPTFKCKVLKLHIDCTASNSWVEIDAVKITGRKAEAEAPAQSSVGKNLNSVEQWVSKVVNYSSQYNSNSWSASSIEGEPKVYPRYGDIGGSWAQKDKDANQFIEVEFKEKIFIDKIYIYETYHAGGVKKIKAKRPNGGWYTVWETQFASCFKSSRIFTPEFQKLAFQCNILRVEVDCTVSGSWVEIDAIKVSGTKYSFDLPPLPEDLGADLEKLVNNPLFSDVRFEVNGKIFYGHKSILAVRSEYCRAMFSFDDSNRQTGITRPSAPPHPDHIKGATAQPPNATQRRNDLPPSYDSITEPVLPNNVPPPAQYISNEVPPVQLKDVDDQAFIVLLHFVYTNKLPPFVQTQILPTVWRTADRFSLEGLKTLVLFELSSVLCVDNVIPIYMDAISTLPVIDDMKSFCESFMQGNMSEIVRHATFKSLPQDDIVELVQMMTLK